MNVWDPSSRTTPSHPHPGSTPSIRHPISPHLLHYRQSGLTVPHTGKKWVMTIWGIGSLNIIPITRSYQYPPALYPRQPTGKNRTPTDLLIVIICMGTAIIIYAAVQWVYSSSSPSGVTSISGPHRSLDRTGLRALESPRTRLFITREDV